MSREMDGFSILQRILENATIFSFATSDAKKKQRSLLVRREKLFSDAKKDVLKCLKKQMKHKSSGLAAFRDMYQAVGEDAFVLAVGSTTDPESNSIVKKLDANHPNAKTSTKDWRQKHILALASSAVEPIAAQKITKGSSGSERLHSEAMAAVRKKK